MNTDYRWRIVATLVITAAVAFSACAGPDPTPRPTPTPPGVTQPTPTAMAPDDPIEAPSFDAEAYFSGRTVVIVNGFAPGGGSDTLARMIATVAPRHFPGNPRFIVQNLAGGGGLRGLEHILRSDPNDPSQFILGMVHSRWIYGTIAGQRVEGFDLDRIKWLGVPNLSSSTTALYARREIATSWEEVLDSGRVLSVGATAPGASGGEAGAQFVEALGGPIRMIYGYGGTAEIAAAFNRGEMDASGSGSRSTTERLFPEWITNKFHVPLFWWGAPIDEDYRDYLALLDADEPIHLYDTVPMTDGHRNVFEVHQSPMGSSTSFLHPDLPDEVYQAVLQMWENIMQDPQYIDLKLAGGFEPEYVTADEIERLIGLALAFSDEEFEFFRVLTGVE